MVAVATLTVTIVRSMASLWFWNSVACDQQSHTLDIYVNVDCFVTLCVEVIDDVIDNQIPDSSAWETGNHNATKVKGCRTAAIRRAVNMLGSVYPSAATQAETGSTLLLAPWLPKNQMEIDGFFFWSLLSNTPNKCFSFFFFFLNRILTYD